jgi:hypothetical protein
MLKWNKSIIYGLRADSNTGDGFYFIKTNKEDFKLFFKIEGKKTEVFLSDGQELEKCKSDAESIEVSLNKFKK